MRLIAPCYYNKFKCIADKCTHNCCIGWKIDIDNDTLEYYKRVSGKFGKRLRGNIIIGDAASFKMGDDERCPFLNTNGLCDIVLTMGENALCQICSDHPRFRNFYSDRTEIGIGLCCEAAAMLILSYPDRMELIPLDFEDEELWPEEKEFLDLREKLFSIIQDRTIDIPKRIENLLEFCGITMQRQTPAELYKVYMGLERLDPARDVLLEGLKDINEHITLPVEQSFSTAFEQLIVYFLYRHLAGALDDGVIKERIMFAIQGYDLIYALCAVHYKQYCKLKIEDLAEIARMYSSEVEYSEENIGVLLGISN